ncbi:MAG TPA: ArsC/Spx/MgsR family protein [Spirochaetia bacterium]|nr:ArsC/Spx/MgsR family protein [Spirochaetia bacterium]
MNIQIIGSRKNPATRKCERFFRDRGINYQFVDLDQRGLSAGELSNIAQALGVDELIDPDSRSYANRGLAYMEFNPLEEILADPLLLRQPIVRDGKRAAVGYDELLWNAWIKEEGKT